MFVLDCVAFLTRRHPQGELLTVSGVEPELVNRRSREYHEQMVATGMQVAMASETTRQQVETTAQETGDAGVLSLVDAELLALALERNATLMRGISVQNSTAVRDLRASCPV